VIESNCSSLTSVHGGKAAARDLAPVFEKAVDVEEVGVALDDALRGPDRFEQATQTGSDVGAESTAASGFRPRDTGSSWRRTPRRD
jgi:hypothetical protein